MSLNRFPKVVVISAALNLSVLMPAYAEDIVFFLENNTSSISLLEFYASPETSTGWEDDILSGTVLGGQQRARITIPEDDRGCVYDFMAIFSNGVRLKNYGIDICTLGTYSYSDLDFKAIPKSTDQASYRFTLTNDTSVDMLEFYASPQIATDWESNILGDETIEANGDWTTITLSDRRGCIYDFLAVFADGDKLEKYGIDVCELENHTYYEN
ncbi:MAG: hypothetical protein F6K11_24790 [Leptolyngbya sp. SIO3F4]|nr:hypothetical protein [Leptolyngbya sp. SIO3F4]